MGLFSVKQRELESIISSLEMNRSNNYKDAAQRNFAELKGCFSDLKNSGKLKPKTEKYYSDIIESYEMSLMGYTHKDQAPYWK